ncbi:hypothetical protein ALQ58_200378 [Pseudomonas syringae pv. apii]|nr:hypothetical protein ALQ58_200378 [Pseudomonas syringae pv. apii]
MMPGGVGNLAAFFVWERRAQLLCKLLVQSQDFSDVRDHLKILKHLCLPNVFAE